MAIPTDTDTCNSIRLRLARAIIVSARFFKTRASLQRIDEYVRTAGRRSTGRVACGGVEMTEGATTQEEERADEHLADVEEGAGCTEIWEHLSERREE